MQSEQCYIDRLTKQIWFSSEKKKDVVSFFFFIESLLWTEVYVSHSSFYFNPFITSN